MSQHSIIEHKANMHYVEFREDYLAICFACTYKKPTKQGKKSKASPYCKAFILSILENWTNTKRGRGEDLYVFMSYQQWSDEMYGMFGRTAIIDSIDELIGEGLISRQPYKMFGRDTFKYLLNAKAVNKLIRALPERDPNVTRPQVNAYPSTSKRVASTSKSDASTSEPVTRPQVNGSHSQVNAYPSTSNQNLSSNTTSSQPHNLSSTERSASESDQPLSETNVPPHSPIQEKQSASCSRKGEAKNGTPQMPPVEMEWSAEKLVQITEARRFWNNKRGAYFSEAVQGKKGKSQRDRQLEAARKILALQIINPQTGEPEGITEEMYIKAYDARNDEWWNTTQGPLSVEHMYAGTTSNEIRILEVLEKLNGKSTAIRNDKLNKQGDTSEQARPSVLVSEEKAKRNFEAAKARVAAKQAAAAAKAAPTTMQTQMAL